MSIKSKLLAGAATLTLVGSVGLAGALTAGPAAAGTPSCGPGCINIFNQDFGPAFVVDVLRQGEKVNQPIILFRNANFDPAEDWSISFQGTVADFFVAGLVDAATALHYGCDAATTGFAGGTCTVFPNLNAFEIEYAPFGVDSGLCMGVAATAFQDEGVTLQPCGVSAKTVWIVDAQTPPISDAASGTATDTTGGGPGELPGYVPLINGSNTNFSHPFVLTYPNGAYPTDKPRAQITVQNLTGFEAPGNGGVLPIISTISSNQLWNSSLGVSP
jgi:hypothetical protein